MYDKIKNTSIAYQVCIVRKAAITQSKIYYGNEIFQNYRWVNLKSAKLVRFDLPSGLQEIEAFIKIEYENELLEVFPSQSLRLKICLNTFSWIVVRNNLEGAWKYSEKMILDSSYALTNEAYFMLHFQNL